MRSSTQRWIELGSIGSLFERRLFRIVQILTPELVANLDQLRHRDQLRYAGTTVLFEMFVRHRSLAETRLG